MANRRGACQRQTGPVFNFNGCNVQIVNLMIQPGAATQGRTFVPTAGIGRPVTKIPAAAPPPARISAPTNRPKLCPAGSAARISPPTKPKPLPVGATRPNNQATLVRPKANGGAANVKKVRETQHNVTGKPKDKVHVGHAKPAVKCVRVVTCHRHG